MDISLSTTKRVLQMKHLPSMKFYLSLSQKSNKVTDIQVQSINDSALILSRIWIVQITNKQLLKWVNFQQMWQSFRMCWNLHKSTYPHLIICTGFPTFCDVKYYILVKKSINNHFKQPWAWNTTKNDFFLHTRGACLKYLPNGAPTY